MKNALRAGGDTSHAVEAPAQEAAHGQATDYVARRLGPIDGVGARSKTKHV